MRNLISALVGQVSFIHRIDARLMKIVAYAIGVRFALIFFIAVADKETNACILRLLLLIYVPSVPTATTNRLLAT